MRNFYNHIIAGTVLVLAASQAQAVPVSISAAGVSLNNLGGNPGYISDLLTVSAGSMALNLAYGASTTVNMQGYVFTVGDTGPGSFGHVEGFSLGRTVTVNGTSIALQQSGQVNIGTFDSLSIFSSASQAFALADGADRYSLSVQALASSMANQSSGAHAGNIQFTVGLSNVEDAPTAQLTGASHFTFGDALQLDARGSFDPDKNSSLTYKWDLDNNGIYDFVGGDLRTFTLADYQGLFANTGGLQTIRLNVTDNTGLSSTALFSTMLEGAPASVPEPGSLFLVGMGALAGLAARRKRARRQA